MALQDLEEAVDIDVYEVGIGTWKLIEGIDWDLGRLLKLVKAHGPHKPMGLLNWKFHALPLVSAVCHRANIRISALGSFGLMKPNEPPSGQIVVR